MSSTITCFVHRDDEGWFAITDWDGEPIIFRLPDDYDPRDDDASLVFEMLGQELSRRLDV